MDPPAQPATPARAPGPGFAARFTRFAVAGSLGVLVNLGLLWVLVERAGMHYALASVVAIEASILHNFAINSRWTWRDGDRGVHTFLNFQLVSLAGMALQWTVLTTSVALLGAHYLVGAAAGVGVATAWNFSANQWFTFAAKSVEAVRRHRVAWMYVAALVLQLGLSGLLAHDWDTFVFQRSTNQFLADGITPYDVGVEKPDYVYWGVGTPAEPLWYAYPPLPLLVMSIPYAPVALGALSDPWAARILIKLPFVVSTLAFAFLAARLVRTAPGESRVQNARRLEAFLLFNPVFILVASVWGQFESMMLCFLALSVLALRRDRFSTAGAFWGLATLVKIFPLYLAPLLGLFLLRKGGARAAARYFASGAAVFAAVSIPFYLVQPQGYLEQVFLMHRDRAPGRFAPLAFLYHTLRWAAREYPGSIPTDTGLISIISQASFILTATVLMLLFAGSWRSRITERSLLAWSGLSMLGGLAVTKVLSEQYMLIPLGLLALATYHGGAAVEWFHEAWARRFLAWATVFVTLSAFVDHALFLIFLPEDVARLLLGQTVHETVRDIGNLFGLTTVQFRALVGTIGGVGLLVPLYAAVRLLSPPLAAGFHVVAGVVHRHPWTRAPAVPGRVARTAVAITLVLLLMPVVSMAAQAPKVGAPPATAGTVEHDAVIVAHYRSDWFNPMIRPEVAGGTWVQTNVTPAGGYYNTIPHKVGADVGLFRALAVDALLISSNPAFEHQSRGVANVAHQARFPYALEVDLRDLSDGQGRLPLTRFSALSARELFDGPGFEFWKDSYHLRLGPDGRRVIFLAGAAEVKPTFTDAERRFVAEVLEEQLRARMETPREAEGPLWEQVPKEPEGLRGDDEEAEFWRQAYESARREWWSIALSFGSSEAEDGFELVVDDPDAVFLPPERPLRILGPYTPVADLAARKAVAAQDFLTVSAPSDDAERFRGNWQAAMESGPAVLILPWNDFDRGQGVEPTLEYGDALAAVVLGASLPTIGPRQQV